MKLRTIGMLLILIVMAVFLIINWTALSQMTTVNLIYKEIEAPLGVLVVCGFGAIVVLLGIYAVWTQVSIFFEIRAAYKEARAARELADNAEKSRDLEYYKNLQERINKLESLLVDRSDEMQQVFRDRFDAVDKAILDMAVDQRKQREAVKGDLMGEFMRLDRKLDAKPAPEFVKAEEKTADEAEVRVLDTDAVQYAAAESAGALAQTGKPAEKKGFAKLFQ